jgi:hypothetical protein
VLKQVELLRYDTDAPAHAGNAALRLLEQVSILVEVPDELAIQGDLAGIYRFEMVYATHERALTGTRRSNDDDDLAATYVKIDAAKHMVVPQPFVDS